MVEAAIFLPIFIIALVTIAYLLRGVSTTETVMHCLVNQGRKLSVEGYAKSIKYEELFESNSKLQQETLKILKSELLSEGSFLFRVDRQLKEETRNWIEDLSLLEFKENYEQDGRTGLTMISLKYNLPIPVPAIFNAEMQFQQNIVLRAFIGRNCDGVAKSFDEMELEKKAQIVYVFPKTGERYHNKSCRFIQNTPREVLLSPAVKKKYHPCKTCQSQTMPIGSMVYIFEESGEVYHRKSCPMVERFVIPMEKEEAQRRGYTPCHICGGESR